MIACRRGLIRVIADFISVIVKIEFKLPSWALSGVNEFIYLPSVLMINITAGLVPISKMHLSRNSLSQVA